MKNKGMIELRRYALPNEFPVLLLTGENWQISNVPSKVLHFHNCTEIGLCRSERGIIQNNQGKFPFKEGDVTFISSNIPHTTYSTQSTLSKWSYIFVNLEELLLPYFSTLLSEQMIKEALNVLFEDTFLIISEEEDPYYRHLLSLMVTVLKEKKANYKIVFRSMMLSLLLSLLKETHTKKCMTDQQDFKVRSRIEPALYYIHHHYNEGECSIEALAKICNVSLTHFRRLFHEAVNESPLDYINRLRIKAAMRLLTTTNLSILNIAEEVGFHSISSFNRQFLKRTGITPSQWRKNHSPFLDGEIVEYNGWLEAESL